MNINIEDIEKLVQCLKDNNLTELEYQEGDSRIVLKDESNTMESPVSRMGMGYPYGQPMYSRQRSNLQELRAITQVKTQADVIESEKERSKDSENRSEKKYNQKNESVSSHGSEDGEYVRAPFGGLFYRQSKPGATPYVQIGSTVKKGDVVGLIEAMKMITELITPCDGVVTEISAQNEQYVEYDTPLFFIKID